MAKGNGILRKISGSVGDLNYRVNKGQQIIAAKATSVSNPKTKSQMTQRTKWANVLAIYQVSNGALKDGFENKASNLSDYNMFMSINLQATPVYLTKQESALKASVAAPYKITQGSLPSIFITGSDASAYTDIALGDLQIGATTTVAQLAKAIVQNNENWEYGDQLSYFSYLQLVNANEGYPYVVCTKSKVELLLDDDSLLYDVVPEYGFATVNGYLGHGTDRGQGAFAWVHSRKSSSSKTLVSTQILVVNNDLYAEYISEAKFTAAAQSYGVSGNVFLKPEDATSTSSATTTDPSSDSDDGNDDSTPSGGGSEDSGNTTPSGGNDDESGGTTGGNTSGDLGD